MKENVGRIDQTLRSVIAPVLLVLGYTTLNGKRGGTIGLIAMISGALLVESAITRVCPINALLGVDTRRLDSAVQRGGG